MLWTQKTLKQVKDLIPFENDLAEHQIQKNENYFQKKIQKDIQLIKSSDEIVTFTDKTTNLYFLTKAVYDHTINNAIISKYKKAINNTKKQIRSDRKQILRNRE